MKKFFKWYSNSSETIKILCVVLVGFAGLLAISTIYTHFDAIVRGLATAVIILIIGYIGLIVLNHIANKLDK